MYGGYPIMYVKEKKRRNERSSSIKDLIEELAAFEEWQDYRAEKTKKKDDEKKKKDDKPKGSSFSAQDLFAFMVLFGPFLGLAQFWAGAYVLQQAMEILKHTFK